MNMELRFIEDVLVVHVHFFTINLVVPVSLFHLFMLNETGRKHHLQTVVESLFSLRTRELKEDPKSQVWVLRICGCFWWCQNTQQDSRIEVTLQKRGVEIIDVTLCGCQQYTCRLYKFKVNWIVAEPPSMQIYGFLLSFCVQWLLLCKDSLPWHYKYGLVCMTGHPATKRQPGWLMKRRADWLISLLLVVFGLIISLPLLVSMYSLTLWRYVVPKRERPHRKW